MPPGAQPDEHGLQASAVRIPGADGLQLFGWYAASSLVGPRPAAVLLHGWGGNASNLLPAAITLHEAGYAVLLVEARNHGRSDHSGHSSLPRFAHPEQLMQSWLAQRRVPYWPLGWLVNRYLARIIGARFDDSRQ